MENKMFNDILDSIISNATPDEIELIREKLNNHLVNHVYDHDIHEELSNDFDGSFCPHCHSHQIIKYGKDKHGNQRFYCKDCHTCFSCMTNTLLSYTKKAPYQWYLYMESLFHDDTIKESALIAGISEYTSLVWRHKILNICAQLTDDDPILSDTVYLDEKLVDVNHIGIENNKPKEIKRGISDQKRNIACAIDEHNHKVIQVSEKGRIHSQELYNIFSDKISSSCTVVSDSLRSYHQFIRDLDVKWIKIPSGKMEKDGYTLQKINLLHSSIELFLHQYRGVSDKYLRNYIGLYKFKDRTKNIHMREVFFEIFKKILNSSCQLKYKDFGNEFSFMMI